MKVEERVLLAIDLGAQGQFEAGMNLILPAIEATAKTSLQKTKIGRNDFKGFLNHYIWLLEAFGLPGVNLRESQFPSIPDMNDGKTLIRPSFADLIYHVFRCSYAHGQDISTSYNFHRTERGDRGQVLIKTDGSKLQLPVSVFWSIVACVVFSTANAGRQTISEHHLTWDGSIPLGRPTPYRFDVDVFWGGEDTVRAFFEKMSIPRVIFDFTSTNSSVS